MQLLLVLAIVAAVSISEYAPHQPVTHVGIRLALAIACMAVAPLFAAVTSTFIAGSLRRDADRRSELLRWFGHLRNLHGVIWFVILGVVLQQIGWVQLVRFNWNLDGTFLIDDLLVLMPVVLPLVLSWIAFYEVDRCVHHVACGNAATPPASRGQYLGLHARHYLGLLLVPVLSVLATQDLVRLLAPAIPGELEAWLLMMPIVGLLAFFPLVLRVLWKTEPLPSGTLRRQLLDFGRRLGFVPGELLVWRTERMIVNAAVAGFVRPWRYVFFTDALLARFEDREIQAVLAHEIGHVRRHHLQYRLLMLVLPVAGWIALVATFPTCIALMSNWLAAMGISDNVQSTIAAPIGLASYAATFFAIHSRWLEYDADLYAVRACEDEMFNGAAPGGEQMALVIQKLAVVGGIGRRTRSWLHPTIADRIDFLLRVSMDPTIGDRFERRLLWFHRSAVATLALLAVYLVVGSS